MKLGYDLFNLILRHFVRTYLFWLPRQDSNLG